MPGPFDCDFDLANICLEDIFDDWPHNQIDLLANTSQTDLSSNSSFMSQQGDEGSPISVLSPFHIQSSPTIFSDLHPSLLESATNILNPELFTDQSGDSSNSQ
uniref:Uncharacterized protein n=2 Tax=Phlebotomus papatasi TaxID=29031 RepID=A0A1B0DAA2_PHLPP